MNDRSPGAKPCHDADIQSGSGDGGSTGDTSSGGDADSGENTGSNDRNGGGSESKNDNIAGKTLAKRAYDLDKTLGLRSTGDYYHNWAKLSEKWMTSTSG